jgi:hypothetical protein
MRIKAMIISHKYRFIFIKTNKTAGTSMEIALSAICGPEDILTPISSKDERVRSFFGYCGPQNYHYKDTVFRAHTSAASIMNYIAPDIWDTYFKFCFERNPWDKVISHYYWRGGGIKYAGLDAYLAAGELEKIKAFSQYTAGDTILVDEIFKFEQLSQAIKTLKQRLELPESFRLPNYKAKSSFRKFQGDYRQFYNQQQQELIRKTFKREIDLMGYQF